MNTIRIEFKDNPKLYKNRHLEIRKVNDQIRFYEVGVTKEWCISREEVKTLMRYGALPRHKVVRQALKRDKSIFDS